MKDRDPAVEVFPVSVDGVVPRLDKATTVGAAMLLLGVILLWFVPLGGALLLVTAGLSLAISVEGPLTAVGASPPTVPGDPPPARR